MFSSGSREEHQALVRGIIQKLADAGLQLDLAKSVFEAQSITYLGYVIEPGKGIRMDPKKVEALRLWEAPRTVRGVRSFLGFANFYREFVPFFSKLATPLTLLTRKDQPWGLERRTAAGI